MSHLFGCYYNRCFRLGWFSEPLLVDNIAIKFEVLYFSSFTNLVKHGFGLLSGKRMHLFIVVVVIRFSEFKKSKLGDENGAWRRKLVFFLISWMTR